ncbi:MAG TPA: hypothetical protein VF849_01435 [Blattabacteriaceae bacterium]
MTITELETFKNLAPFKPFKINTVDGKSTQIFHPDFIYFIPPINRVIILNQELQLIKFIDISYITSIEQQV